jgi:putative NIF3 family GTP cyclohydrolase 1 type 2
MSLEDILKTDECEKYMFRLFSVSAPIAGEMGFTNKASGEIKLVGYATNLTPEVIVEAVGQKVGLILTHHDAWEFIYGMKEQCMNMLRKHRITHCFSHAPLDGADFGTNESIVKCLGARSIEKATLEQGYWCGRIAEFDDPLTFDELAVRVERMCGEKVMKWRNNDRPVKRIGVVSGGGFMTSHMKEYADKGCDAYITGEKMLYTVEYAKYAGMSLIVGSHTFTELPGVESWAMKLRDQFPEIETVRLEEPHIEL